MIYPSYFWDALFSLLFMVIVCHDTSRLPGVLLQCPACKAGERQPEGGHPDRLRSEGGRQGLSFSVSGSPADVFVCCLLRPSRTTNKGRRSSGDLSGVDLAKKDLAGFDLRGANLTGANLGEADLSKADLGQAARGAFCKSVTGEL